jgi:murein L,D-transpeptidase YcbB/YkuD
MNNKFLSKIFIVSLLISSIISCKSNNKSETTSTKLIATEIKTLFDNQKEPKTSIEDSSLLTTPNETIAAYKDANYEPLWIKDEGLTNNGQTLINFIRNARSYGLIPEAYNLQKITSQYNKLQLDSLWENERKNPKNWARIDILLTDAFLSISRNLDRGYIPLDSLSKDATYSAAKYKEALINTRKTDNLLQILESFEPKSKSYQDLKKLLPNFLSAADFSKKYTFIDYPITNKNKFVAQIIKRSKEENLLPNDVTNLDSIELSNLVKRIQEKKNLEIDGKYGRQLILALNNTDSEKFLKIVINMDRLRRNREEYPNRYLWVNLPSFYLQVFENGETKIESKVIIGKPNTRTPLITSKINQITTYPTWTIPTSIISKEILPNIKKNNNYLNRKGYSIFDASGQKVNPDSVNWSSYEKGIPFKVVQPGGDANSLGIMKFNFPNKYSVYLHDTNQRSLFNNSFRSLSHGCVRVQNWDSLYQYIILSDKRANDDDIASNGVLVDSVKTWLNAKKRRTVSIVNELPIYIRYYTAASKNGKIEFYEDVYGEDNKIRNLIMKSINPIATLN